MSFSQSLFQVYFLGSTEVDKRCDSSVIPWLIEELKLELKTMKLVWVTLGPSNIEYVADSGEELSAHSYSGILRWETGFDNISIAYITSIDDISFCHVFQCLDLEEVNKICMLLKRYCVSHDVNRNPILLSGDELASLMQKQSKSISRHTTITLPITYCGKINIKLKQVIAETVDDVVSCLYVKDRPTAAKKYKKWKKRRTTPMSAALTNSLFRKSSTSDEASEPVVSDNLLPSNDNSYFVHSTPLHYSNDEITLARPSDESHSGPLTKSLLEASGSCSKSKISFAVMESDSGTKKLSWIFDTLKGRSSSSRGNTIKGDSYTPSVTLGSDQSNQENDNKTNYEGNTIPSLTLPTPAHRVLDSSESSVEADDVDGGIDENDLEFDVLPELLHLRQEPEFAALGVNDILRIVRSEMSIAQLCTLSLSSTELQITPRYFEDTSEYSQVLSLDQKPYYFSCGIRHILGCAQGIVSSEYIGFITREKSTSVRSFHLLKTANSKLAASLIKSFKNCFDCYITGSLPFTLCETCPVHFFNSICKKLSELPLSSAQSQIHTLMLSHLTETEYTKLAKNFHKDPFTNEHTQLVQWVTLLRTFCHHQQKTHSHHSIKIKKKSGKEKGRQVPVLKGSYDSLKLKPELLSYSACGLGKMSSSSDQLESLHITDDICPAIISPTIHIEDTMSPTSIRDASECNTSIRYDKFPPTEIHLSPRNKENFQMKTVSSRPCTESGAIIRSTVSPTGDSGHVSPTGRSPFKRGHQRSMSWRQQIFESVTPSKDVESTRRLPSISQIMELGISNNVPQRISFTESISESEETDISKRAKSRWQWAINQQLLLIRLEKENLSVIRDTLRHHKLNYADPAVDNVVMVKVWLALIEEGSPSPDSLLAAIKMGVPPKLRERVWPFLVSHYQSCHPGEVPLGNYRSTINKQEYEELCEQPTEYEYVISADIGRTYPNHPYFSSKLQLGRVALYNVLRAYAVSDPEIGYCQGLSFIVGLLLLHSTSELEAFTLLNHFMHLYGYRDIYSQDMYVLQIKLYQFSRLLHDHLPTLHSHLEKHDVTPFLYAAPWFLTLFSSQFPISFVARITDLFLYEGISAIFKVGLGLLTHYRYEILELNHMETITNFLKITIPEKVTDSISEILHTSTQIIGLAVKLNTFETEYHVMHELMATFHMKQSSSIDMETMNELLRKQNKDLIEQLAVCRGAIMRLERAIELCNTRIDEQQQKIQSFEHGRKAETLNPSVNKETQTTDEFSD